MRRSPFRRSIVVAFPVLALAAVALSSGQQVVGGPSSPPTGSTGSTTGTTTGGSGTTGGQGPVSPGGGWVVEYNAHGGKVTFEGSSTPWDRYYTKDADGWYSDPSSVGGHDHPGTNPPSLMSVTVTSAGSPKIRLRWTGSGSPPAVAWLLVDSTASWTSTRGSGGADNGFSNDQ